MERGLPPVLQPTAAFPAILDNAIRKNIVQMYQEIPTTFQLWTTKQRKRL